MPNSLVVPLVSLVAMLLIILMPLLVHSSIRVKAIKIAFLLLSFLTTLSLSVVVLYSFILRIILIAGALTKVLD